ncbi:hypothetical protein RISK_005795 [Rhodopirellula islandica]|uniref:Uncharacterized protein n=1 Tax=Rhodopirellula islandica TaxID=595434 RepID=A0A0J1B5M2_RHOIS|nr:hypothetical protein RISK_005795 [Rhodopirellula islandica]
MKNDAGQHRPLPVPFGQAGTLPEPSAWELLVPRFRVLGRAGRIGVAPRAEGVPLFKCRARSSLRTPPAAEVVPFFFTLPLGGADRFGPGRVTRWIQC